METANQTPAGTPADQTQAPGGAPGASVVRGSSTGEIIPTGKAPAEAPGATGAPGAGASPPGGATPPASPGSGAPGPKKITISEADLKERLQRAENARLKKMFGTDDPKVIAERMKRMEELEAQQEAERQARLSNEQKLQEQLAAEKARADKAQQRAQALEEQRVVQQQGSVVSKAASAHVHQDYIEEASLAFARHVQQHPREVARFTEKDIGKWFSDYVAKKPALARTATPPAPQPQQQRVERTPAGSPRPPPRPQGPQPPSNPQGRTLRPGQPNSMTRQEASAELRKRGINYG